MTIQEAKDQAAKEFGYKDFWDGFLQRYNPSLKHTITDLINRSLEIYAEAKAKEANETIEMLRHSLAQATANRIFEKENIEKEAYNQGVRDAAESAELVQQCGEYKPYCHKSNCDNCHKIIDKDSILKLLK